MLKIRKEILEKIKEEAKKGYPFEICGFLIGNIDYQNNLREVILSYQVENQNKERANDRFEISPRDYLKVENFAEEKNLLIVGIYHSHPDHPSRPSQTDLMFAQPDLSYIIISASKDKINSIQSWYLEGDRFQEEEIIL
ncbi:M67 family metallopeptidase [Venenivibrio stagnispumantis]|uniref:Proteasome lid subunit RPN8/RPN11, contains Jab1/MPN metalloenzyme (JAMM) motif n=1 Tax=Venenivibrio stagnispumantis TaxID=407998 RepID=A0AA45WMG8_9AQUI|nr:M67 family metallopeptidase [Venenivibrio stagnispumantis]MCW4573636.1 M67 family metallopeptidase [Venenivibrio stagnispumantis]SMP14336.1 Proteasome lid subunit RPN8/RPN11, contains Jab1/MPN metalloenzyme (JAMM) motif [Venenivibrio stagnispumantis]